MNQESQESLDLSVIVPVFNEEENLPLLHQELIENLDRLQKTYEILFIDDGSTDNSVRVMRRLSESSPALRIIRFKRNCGQTDAFAAGFETARGNVIVTMDADLQNDPADISVLLGQMSEFDVVCGWRQKRNDPWIKRVSSKIANAVRNALSDEQIADTGCSLKAFRRECFDQLKLYKGMHRFFPTLLKMEGFRVTQVKVQHRPRRHGVSKYNIRNRVFASFVDLLAVRWMKKRKLTYEIAEED